MKSELLESRQSCATLEARHVEQQVLEKWIKGSHCSFPLLGLPRCSLLQAVCADFEQRAEQSASDNARLSTKLEALLGKKSELEETNEGLRSQLAEHTLLLIQEKEKVRWQPSQF